MRLIKFILVLVFLVSCNHNNDETINCTNYLESIDFSFGLDYENQSKYLISGEQSGLDTTYITEIQNEIGPINNTIGDILKFCHWFNQNFSFSNAGGGMIGSVTANDIYKEKTYYGCHSAALFISSALRKFNFPAVMVETACIQWAYDYNDGTTQMFAGHVMSEIYVDNKWILLDNNCTYIENYDPLNPYISTMDQNYWFYNQGLFVIAKGVDTWDYYSKTSSDTEEMMLDFAENIECLEDYFDTVNYIWKNEAK